VLGFSAPDFDDTGAGVFSPGEKLLAVVVDHLSTVEIVRGYDGLTVSEERRDKIIGTAVLDDRLLDGLKDHRRFSASHYDEKVDVGLIVAPAPSKNGADFH